MTTPDDVAGGGRPAPPLTASGVRPPPPTPEEIFYREAAATCRAFTVLCHTITEAIRWDLKRDGYEPNHWKVDQ